MNSCITVARQLAVAGLGVVMLVWSARAQAQIPIEQVPLYPGAAPPPTNEELPSPQLGITLDSSRLYVVPASIEAVVRFYQQRLSAREVDAQAFEAALARADAEPLAAVFTLTEHDFTSPAVAGLKGAVTSRPPYRPGQWLNWARFVWSQRQGTGDVATFGVSVVDGMDMRRPKEPRTVLEIAAGVSGGRAVEEQPAAPEENRARPALTEPSPAELGVPRYPGARFDGSMSAGLSSGGDRYFVYTTADLPEKVAAFYERETGKKGLRNEGGWLIAVKGSGLFPELGVAVQPNAGTYPPAVKTMITVRRGRPG
jgi:hypothetical protein